MKMIKELGRRLYFWGIKLPLGVAIVIYIIIVVILAMLICSGGLFVVTGLSGIGIVIMDYIIGAVLIALGVIVLFLSDYLEQAIVRNVDLKTKHMISVKLSIKTKDSENEENEESN